MKVSCILFTLLFVLFSCQESEKERISRLVKEWDGKEIVFPDRPVFTIQGRDIASCPSGNSPYKVLTYIDSLGCASCKLQLPRWKFSRRRWFSAIRATSTGHSSARRRMFIAISPLPGYELRLWEQRSSFDF